MKYGEIFNKFKIGELLGKGGSSEVYVAEHLILKQLLAIKIMSPSQNPLDLRRFIKEAQISCSLDHPNIVKVINVDKDEKSGKFFISMEYIRGNTLQQLSHEKVFSEKELLDILTAITSALAFLHDKKIVHRDIKPSNIMLSDNGKYKLMDLGIAKMQNLSDEEQNLTMTNVILGTPDYASPEQCRAAGNVDIRSDIYSLGATIYHLASGNRPFSGRSPVETTLNVLNNAPEPLVKYRPDLSRAFIALVQQMMNKSPDKRPQTPKQLLTLLEKTKIHSSPLQYIWQRAVSTLYHLRAFFYRTRLTFYIIAMSLIAGYLVIFFCSPKNIKQFFDFNEKSSFAGWQQIAAFTPPQSSGEIQYNAEKGEYQITTHNPGIEFYAASTGGNMKKSSVFYANRLVVPRLTVQTFAVSVDYQLAANNNILTYGNNDELVMQQKHGNLQLVLNNKHTVDIPMPPSKDTWRNILISYDGRNKYLHFFNKEKYLGTFPMARKLSVPGKIFSLGNRVLWGISTIRNFTVWNGVKTPSGKLNLLKKQ